MDTLKGFIVRPTPREQLRTTQREIKSIQRDLERDKLQLQREQKQIEIDIKKAAKRGDTAQARTLAKQLIRLRNQQEKNQQVSAQISAVGHRAIVMHSNASLGRAIQGTTKAMAASNKHMNISNLQKTMMEYDKQNAQMDMAEEMMNDTIDGVMDGSEDEAESEDLMNKVLDEIGIELNSKLASAPRAVLRGQIEEYTINNEDLELEQRLKALKNI